MTRTSVLQPSGGFSLRAAAGFGFGPTEGRPPPFDGCLRLAFALDGGSGYAGVVLRQPGDALDAAVTVEVHTADGADGSAAVAQAARIVSLDHDGEEFARAGERDPTLGELQRAHPGQRPVLFHSPYEAAAWAIISARRPSRQAATVRAAIAERFGRRFELAGRTLHAFPQPDHLFELPDPTPGLNTDKVERLRGLAATAATGALEAARLLEVGPERAFEEAQRIKGVGPFYAALIVVRATGFADALLPVAEPRVLENAGRLYGLGRPMSLEELAAAAEAWRPRRTWATVLIRLAGDRGSW